jgi:hypothetical protein
MSNIYVQTRGKNTDYAFLGGALSKQLWWQDFGEATSFEQPTIIVRGDGSEWRCYVSGIQSERRDRVGTIIRYTIVLDGQCGEAKDSALALKLVADALKAVPDQRVQTELDNEFDETAVERLLSNPGANPDDRDKVGHLAAQALSNLEPLKPPIKLTKPTEAESWVGSRTSSFAQSEFLARSAKLFRGESKGVAALLNLLGTVDEVQKLLEQQETSLAVLIEEDSPGTLGDKVLPISRKKKESRPPPQPAPPSQGSPSSQGISIPQVVLVVVVIFSVWLAIRSPDPMPQQTPQLQTPTIRR